MRSNPDYKNNAIRRDVDAGSRTAKRNTVNAFKPTWNVVNTVSVCNAKTLIAGEKDKRKWQKMKKEQRKSIKNAMYKLEWNK